MTESFYEQPYLYPKQREAIFGDPQNPKRYRLCEASTKSGKTVASIAQIIEWAIFGNGQEPVAPGQHYWWAAPVSDQARIAFNRVKTGLTPGSFTARESPTPTISLLTGTSIDFKSSDNPDSLYGEDVFGAVMDEASRAKPEAWYALRSTLTATRGPLVAIGNVKGRKNWFYEFCRRAENGLEPNAQFRRITWRDAVEARVLDLDEIEDARRNLPEQVFRELYEAEASDDGSNPFGVDHIRACIDRDRDIGSSIPVAFGWDLAKVEDWTVGIALDADCRVCRFYRWRTSWENTINRIRGLTGDAPALVDATGVGDPIVEALRNAATQTNFKGFKFTAQSKQQLIENLAVAIQKHEIGFPEGEITKELEHIESKETLLGVRYEAGYGHNDDCVMALALALRQFRGLEKRARFTSMTSWTVPSFIPIFAR